MFYFWFIWQLHAAGVHTEWALGDWGVNSNTKKVWHELFNQAVRDNKSSKQTGAA